LWDFFLLPFGYLDRRRIVINLCNENKRRMVINLCLCIYIAQAEDEEFSVVDAV
jgi:hypothetical protein